MKRNDYCNKDKKNSFFFIDGLFGFEKYNKYDLLLKGNLGEDGEEKIIAEIESSKDVKYLILQDKYHKNWQTPLQVINNVKENKNKTGTIGDFDIYE